VLRSGRLDGAVERDQMGETLSHWRPLTRKPVLAGADELARNGRSRSAKLRVAERTEYDVRPWRPKGPGALMR
jgi:16S rRNA (cytosine1402-N4)-methyltransferase